MAVFSTASHGKDSDVDNMDGGNLMIQALFSSGSDCILWASAQNKDKN